MAPRLPLKNERKRPHKQNIHIKNIFDVWNPFFFSFFFFFLSFFPSFVLVIWKCWDWFLGLTHLRTRPGRIGCPSLPFLLIHSNCYATFFFFEGKKRKWSPPFFASSTHFAQLSMSRSMSFTLKYERDTPQTYDKPFNFFPLFLSFFWRQETDCVGTGWNVNQLQSKT